VLTAKVLAGFASAVLFAVPTQAGAAPDNDLGPSVDEPGCIVSLLTGLCELSVSNEQTWPPEEQDEKGKTVSDAGCRWKGKVVPCTTSDGFFDAESGCYLTAEAEPTTFADTSNLPPGTRFYECWVILDVVNGKPVGIERFESVIRTPGELQTIDPRVAAQEVVETMNFVAPALGLSPYAQSATHEAIVNVPIWMWVTDPGDTTTGPQTKRAELGGVAIEATATVDRIEWSMGGGDVVNCKGAGTPFNRAAAEGKSLKEIPASPTCGHKYRKTSRCEKGGTFQITATAYWNVHWTGGGTEGDIPLNFSRSLPLQVVDLRPVLVAPDGSANSPQSTPAPRPCP